MNIRKLFKAAGWLFSPDPWKRRRIRQEAARIAASLFGDFPISEDHKLWREDRKFFADYRRLTPNSYSEDRKYTLRELVRFTCDLDGDMAECGCFEGATAWFMADECPGTPLHLFDSFEGLSEPDRNDKPEGDELFEWAKGDLSASEEKVRRNLAGFDNVSYYKGWIPTRFDDVADRRFRFVHLDVDLYQPTLDSLEFFYPRMVEGGVILLDDYGFTSCPGAKKATDEFFASRPEHVLHLPTGQGFAIKLAESTPHRPAN
ncbi:MAG: class I SAM-dependent methyltransferase [Gammaproteobacteria bacterium]|nr:class I SAM-dependent methyltransferase [Gammaproteobacteria bacterium]